MCKCCASADDFCQEPEVWLHNMLWMVSCALGVLAAATFVVTSILLSIFMCQSMALRMHVKTDIVYLETSLLRLLVSVTGWMTLATLVALLVKITSMMPSIHLGVVIPNHL